jgi:Mg-chelatase subunit ChlI
MHPRGASEKDPATGHGFAVRPGLLTAVENAGAESLALVGNDAVRDLKAIARSTRSPIQDIWAVNHVDAHLLNLRCFMEDPPEDEVYEPEYLEDEEYRPEDDSDSDSGDEDHDDEDEDDEDEEDEDEDTARRTSSSSAGGG